MPSRPKKHRDMGCEYHYNSAPEIEDSGTYLVEQPEMAITPFT